MGTHDYRLKSGRKIPSTTTILSRFKESGGLIHWAWERGKAGEDYKKARDDSANAGTLVHEMIELEIKGETVDLNKLISAKGVTDPEQIALLTLRAETGFQAYHDWLDGSKIVIEFPEVPLVSEVHEYGGCIDAVGKQGEKRVLLDWKTSNATYADHVLQLAAYRELWNENHPEDLIEAVHLLRFGKEWGDFHHHSWPLGVINLGWRMFELHREAYEIDKELRKVVK